MFLKHVIAYRVTSVAAIGVTEALKRPGNIRCDISRLVGGCRRIAGRVYVPSR